MPVMTLIRSGGPKERGPWPRVAAIVALLLASSGVFSPAAQAYQVATAPAIVAGGVGTTTMPGSGLTTSISATGLTSVTNSAQLGGRGYIASDYTPGLASTTPVVNLLTEAVNNCPAVGACSGLGTITITFSQPVTNPILSLAGIGGEVHILGPGNVVTGISQLHDILSLTTPGVTLTDLSGANLAVSGNQITTNNDNAGYRCETTTQSDPATGTTLPSAATTAGCGSVRVNGTVTSVTFNVSAVFTQTTASVPAYTNNTVADPVHNADGFAIAVTAPEDFGDAPSSYDQGNAARAVLSDIKLGSSVTEDNATVANGTVSPNASATAALDGADNGVTLTPLTTATTSYSTTVALSGASKAGTVCGWIDIDKDGIFDNPAERACATFAAGATSATLSWSGISGLTSGATYARVRVGYNATQTQSPIGAADSGEVEDYRLTINATPFPCLTPTVFNASGSPLTQLYAQNQSATGSTFTPIGSPTANGYNAIAFNTADNLIYAIGAVSHLFQVDATGLITDLGAITGIPVADTTSGLLTGAFDAAGNYWVTAAGASGIAYRVNLTTRVATPLAGQTTPWRAFDFTYANGFMWGISSNSTTMLRLNLTTGAMSSFSLSGLIPLGQYGAAWTYGNGNLGFDINGGGVYQIAVTNPAATTPTFTLVATGPGPASIANDGTSCVPGPVDLSIAKTGPATVLPNGQVSWTLTVHNNGPNISSGWVVNDVVPAGYTNVASSTPGCVVTGNAVRCLGGILAVGADAPITITATAPGTLGCIVNTASVLGNEADPAATNNTDGSTTCVAQSPGLTLVKSASISTDTNNDALAGVGDEVTFTFTLENTGDVTLTAVAVADQLVAPAGPAVAVTCPATTMAPHTTLVCTSTPYVVTQADVDAGAVRNTATASGTPPTGGPVTTPPSSTVTTAPGPGIKIVKSADLRDRDGDRLADAGEPIVYHFAVKNTGATTLRDVMVNDDRLVRMGLTVTCPATTLAPATSMICTSSPYVVTQADVDAGAVLNVATATATSPDDSVVTSPPSGTRTPTDRGPVWHLLAYTGANAPQILLYAMLLLGLGVLLLIGRRAIASPTHDKK